MNINTSYVIANACLSAIEKRDLGALYESGGMVIYGDVVYFCVETEAGCYHVSVAPQTIGGGQEFPSGNDMISLLMEACQDGLSDMYRDMWYMHECDDGGYEYIQFARIIETQFCDASVMFTIVPSACDGSSDGEPEYYTVSFSDLWAEEE